MLQSTGLREDALIKGANVTGLEGQKAGLGGGGGDGGGGLSSAFAGSLACRAVADDVCMLHANVGKSST